MPKDTVITLHRPTRAKNSIGEWISTIQLVDVFARVQEVSSFEFFSASQIGLNPEKRFLVFAGDYQNEMVITHEGVNYSVYRTYKPSLDTVEIYCQREAGTASVQSNENQS